MIIKCPKCQTDLEVSEDIVGRNVRCSICNIKFKLSLKASVEEDFPVLFPEESVNHALKSIDTTNTTTLWKKINFAFYRWGARTLDYYLVCIIYTLIIYPMLLRGFLPMGGSWTYFYDYVFPVLFYFAVDIAVFAIFHTTLGKFLFNLHLIKNNGEQLSTIDYATRNLLVCGAGFFFGILAPIAMIVQLVVVCKFGNTRYDTRHGFLCYQSQHVRVWRSLLWILMLTICCSAGKFVPSLFNG